MKRFLIVVAVGVVAGGALFVATAPGSQTAGPTTAQFKALKREVASLSIRLNTLKRAVGALHTTVSNDDSFINDCLSDAWGVSEYGDAAGATFGYSYSEDGNTYFLTTALDFDTSGSPNVWLQGVNASCVGPFARRQAAHRLEPGRTAAHVGPH